MFLHLAIIVLGFTVMFGGLAGAGRLIRGIGNAVAPLLTVVLRGLVVLLVVVAVYLALRPHAIKLAEYLGLNSVQSQRRSP